MISFLLCLAILIGGYFVYGKIVDNTFGPDDRETPAVRINDGVDYVVMPQWKLFLVQLLNIAGLGPIFGALQGALWGPVVFLWITFGTIFAGGVHDYFSGMMSERNDGGSIAEITGKYLGPVMQNVMRVFSVVLLIMVGTVFAVGPAGLIVTLCKNSGMSGVLTTTLFWLIIILVYYFIATFISIDAVIGKIYPIFGICLIIMAVGVIFGIFTNPAYTIPEIWQHFGSMHPSGTPIWSFMFITVACGAISGFHSTQSPLMARCMKSEKQGHFVFYGAMVCEGIIALIWAAAGCSLYEITGGLNTGLAAALAEGQSAAIYDVCSKTMGGVNGYAVSAYTKAPNASLAFVEFAASYEMQVKRSEMLGVAPAREDAAEQVGGISALLYENLEKGTIVLMPSIQEVSQIWTPAQTFFTDIAKDAFRSEGEKKYPDMASLKAGLEAVDTQIHDAIFTLK